MSFATTFIDAINAAGIASQILSAVQAEAVYRAMCELNNVGGRLEVVIHGVRVKERTSGIIQIDSKSRGELFLNQAAFAAAYGLDDQQDTSNAALDASIIECMGGLLAG